MNFTEMKKSTRVGVSGKNIRCPHCGNVTRVYHLSWCALQCQGCDKMVDKYEFEIETKVAAKRTKVNLKRSEWQCYLDTPDEVIEKVNKFFTYVLPKCDTPVLAQRIMYEHLDRYVQWGFLDSECCQVATDTINKHFKSDIDRWQCMNDAVIRG